MKSDKQKQAIAQSRNKELSAVANLDPQFYCQGDIGTFISLYLQAEVFAKKIQRYYRTDTNKNGKDELNIKVLKAAISHFSLSFKHNDVDSLFKGGSGTQNNKSARQLRNGYLHSLSANDKKEITSKSAVFNSKLKAFLALRV